MAMVTKKERNKADRYYRRFCKNNEWADYMQSFTVVHIYRLRRWLFLTNAVLGSLVLLELFRTAVQ